MFFNDKSKSYMNHWYHWAISQERESLFQDIRQLVEDMIKELTPPLIYEYLKERLDTLNTLNFDIRTALNGKANDLGNLRQDIEDYVIETIKKSLK